MPTTSPRPLRAAERVLKSARALFYAHGIRAVGVEEIVQDAHVTKPSLYRAFASKDGLTTAYLAAYTAEFRARIGQIAERFPGDPRGVLLAYFDDLGRRASGPDYRGCALSNALIEYPEVAHPVREAALRLKAEMHAWLLEQARALDARDPLWLADCLAVLMEGAYGAGQTYPEPGPAARIGALARLLVDGQCPEDKAART